MILPIWKKSIEIKTFAGLYPNDYFMAHTIFRTFFLSDNIFSNSLTVIICSFTKSQLHDSPAALFGHCQK